MPKTSERNSRYLFAIIAAVLPTVALLYLMTRLIVPAEGDQVVKQMIDRFELRILRQMELKLLRKPTNNPEIELMPVPDREDFLLARDVVDDGGPENVPLIDTQEDEPLTEESPENTIDWYSEARKVVEGRRDEHLAQWRIDQGYDAYRSIMQGDMPSRTEQEASVGKVDAVMIGQSYINTYGEKEVRISENCYMQIPRPSLYYFGAVRYDPPQIHCKRPKRPDLSFRRE